MKYPVIILLFFAALLSCNTPSPKAPEQASAPAVPRLSHDQSAFIRWWLEEHAAGKPALLNIFRTRYFSKQDLGELKTFLKGQKLEADFSKAEALISERIELEPDTTLLHARWIRNSDVSACNDVDPEFWPCFNRRYPDKQFYYLSVPLFSANKKFCLLSVNFLNSEKAKAYGGGRLYQRKNDKWEEIAILSYWGKKPE